VSEIAYLTKEDILAIADVILPSVAMRDAGQLHTAALRPQTTAFGQDAYPTLWDKAAALLQSLVIGHPLMDGNERLGWVCAVIFLRLNGESLHYTDTRAAYELVIAVATGELIDIPDMAALMRKL
jgi:death on curing protein